MASHRASVRYCPKTDNLRGFSSNLGSRTALNKRFDISVGVNEEVKFQEVASSLTEGPYRPPEAATAVNASLVASDTPAGAYERQKQIERASYGLAVQALRNKTMDAGRMVTVHAAAAKNLINARQDVLALAEKERSLVSGSWWILAATLAMFAMSPNAPIGTRESSVQSAASIIIVPPSS